jgi:signal transduction histidine kinase
MTSPPVAVATAIRSEPGSRPLPTDAQRLRRANAELELLYAVEQDITTAEGLTELLARVLDRLASHLRFEAAALLLVRGGGEGEGEVCSVLRGKPMTRRLLPRSVALSWLEQTRVRSSRVLEAADRASSLLSDVQGAHLVRAYNVPLSGGSNQYGVLQLVASRELPAGDETILRQLVLVAGQLGRAIMLRREREQQLRTERLAQLSDSLAAIQQELHTPMLAVAGYVDIMASADAHEVRREYAERIGRGLQHIERTVDEVLAYARGQREVAVNSLSLARFVDETRELLEPELSRFGASLGVQADYLGSARFDASKLQRVLLNLARNAGQAGAKKFLLKITRYGEYLVFECSDTGPGMSAEDRALLFDPTRTRGLGLAIAKTIIDAHCGHIHVKSDSGHGTVFRIELPF